MPIEIKITDPQLMPQALVVSTVEFLMKLAGMQVKIGRPPIEDDAPSVPALPEEDIMLKNEVSDEVGSISESLENEAGDEIDTKGTPWDKRIHARTRSKNPDGTWKLQRGINEKMAENVLREINPSLTPPAPVVPPVPAHVEPNVPPAPLVSPQVDPIAPSIDYGTLMTKITSAVAAGKLTRAKVSKILQDLGAPPLQVLATRPDLIPQVADMIDLMVDGV